MSVQTNEKKKTADGVQWISLLFNIILGMNRPLIKEKVTISLTFYTDSQAFRTKQTERVLGTVPLRFLYTVTTKSGFRIYHINQNSIINAFYSITV